jgi:hypothetical protein
MNAVLALSPNPDGFTSSDLAAKVRQLLHDDAYRPSTAAYDLRKLRCKGLVSRIGRSRRYYAEPAGLRAMGALLLLRDKVLRPLIASEARTASAPKPRLSTTLDQRYRAVHQEMRSLFNTLGMAA